MSFGEPAARLREFLDRRPDIVEQIDRSGLPLELSRIGEQLAAAHRAEGFEPIALEGKQHAFDSLALIARGHQHWDRYRRPGRNVRLRFADRVYSAFVLQQLEHLSLRIWDDGPETAASRLDEIQRLLDRLNAADRAEPLIRDARWLIQTAQGPLTRGLAPYFRIAGRIAVSFTTARRLEIHRAGALLTSGHLRSQLRHRASESNRAIDDPDVLAVTRNSNSMDAALLVGDLIPLLDAYATAAADGDERLALADAILQGLSADPELLLARLDLLGPCTTIEDLFVEQAPGGAVRYTALGHAHVQRLASYAGLIGRHATALLEDARRLDPRHAPYSPLGLTYGFCADLLANMALDTLLARQAMGLTLEEMFAFGGDAEDKRARADGWDAGYSSSWAVQMFDRAIGALAARAAHPDRANATEIANGRVFIESAPAGTPAAQEHCLTSDLPRALATGATAFPRGQLLVDRNEGRFLASAETDGKWFAISKVLLTQYASQGKDALLSGVPAPVVERLRLICPDLVVIRNS